MISTSTPVSCLILLSLLWVGAPVLAQEEQEGQQEEAEEPAAEGAESAGLFGLGGPPLQIELFGGYNALGEESEGGTLQPWYGCGVVAPVTREISFELTVQRIRFGEDEEDPANDTFMRSIVYFTPILLSARYSFRFFDDELELHLLVGLGGFFYDQIRLQIQSNPAAPETQTWDRVRARIKPTFEAHCGVGAEWKLSGHVALFANYVYSWQDPKVEIRGLDTGTPAAMAAKAFFEHDYNDNRQYGLLTVGIRLYF